ncbi:MAG: hypothetical protein ABSE51_19165 [Terracidiphilus sp.]
MSAHPARSSLSFRGLAAGGHDQIPAGNLFNYYARFSKTNPACAPKPSSSVECLGGAGGTAA